MGDEAQRFVERPGIRAGETVLVDLEWVTFTTFITCIGKLIYKHWLYFIPCYVRNGLSHYTHVVHVLWFIQFVNE